MQVSLNASILRGLIRINHPFWDSSNYENPQKVTACDGQPHGSFQGREWVQYQHDSLFPVGGLVAIFGIFPEILDC